MKQVESIGKVEKMESSLKWYHWLIFLAVVLMWLGGWAFVSNEYSDLKDAGPFGDMFGFINSLFSGLAFAGIIITIILQSQELREQRKEMAENRKVMIDQKQEMEAQVKAMNAQVSALEKQGEQMNIQAAQMKKQNTNLKRDRFETSFLSMIRIHLDSVKESPGLLNRHLTEVKNELQNWSPMHVEERTSAYAQIVSNNIMSQHLSPYIRSFIAAYKHLLEYKPRENGFNRYISMLRSYLSVKETQYLFIHQLYCPPNSLNIDEIDLLRDFFVKAKLVDITKEHLNKERILFV